MYELATTIVVSFVITWSIGLLPPVLIRYAIIKHPIAKWPTIGTCALLWVINIVLFTAMGSQSKTHGALTLVAFVSYWILRRPTTKNEQEQNIAIEKEEKFKLKHTITSFCPSCGHKYTNFDYRKDAEVWLCSQCKEKLPIL